MARQRIAATSDDRWEAPAEAEILAALRQTLAAVEERAARYRAAIELLEEGISTEAAEAEQAHPTAQSSPNGSAGRARPRRSREVPDIIVDVLYRRPGAALTAEQIYEDMTNAGWSPAAAHPLPALRSALSRLAKSGRIERVGAGRYRAVALTSPVSGQSLVSAANPASGTRPQPNSLGTEGRTSA